MVKLMRKLDSEGNVNLYESHLQPLVSVGDGAEFGSRVVLPSESQLDMNRERERGNWKLETKTFRVGDVEYQTVQGPNNINRRKMFSISTKRISESRSNIVY